jgi:RNAse (barnase) inhibitor barstar
MKGSPIGTIDVGTATTREELHATLADALGFPDYYGHNWDAFDECIRDVPLPDALEISGLEQLRSCLPREAELLERCLDEF